MQHVGRGTHGSRGFTLVELLVVLLILSILIAAVIPVVSQQVDAADAPRAASDLTGIRDAIAIFRTNVRDYPGDLEDLANKIVAGTDVPVDGGAFTATEVKRWKGPYLELSTAVAATATDTAFTTSFDGKVQNDLTCYVAADDSTGNRGATCSVANDSTIFVTAMVHGLGQTAFNALNQLIDGEADTTAAGAGNGATGRLRRRIGGADTTFYLAVPVPP